MRLRLPLLLCVMLLAPTGSSWAQDAGSTVLAAIRTERWADAQAAASRFADPVTQKLVLYYRLRAPGAATAPEIAGFMRDNPDWPAQGLLERRREEAIAAEPDAAIVLEQCTPDPALPSPRPPITLGRTLLRCAEAFANAGHTAEANATARHAWVDAIDDAAGETAFLNRWAGIATPEDQWLRFERLAWSDTAAATRQLPRLDAAHRAAAQARLAVKQDQAGAEALVATLPVALRDDPGMVLDRARMLRRTDHIQEALSLWQHLGAQAQNGAPTHGAEFWAERNLLTRRLLRDGNPAGAYAIAAGHGQKSGEAQIDAEFLAGFIALRLLHEPGKAEPHFRTLSLVSGAAITQARAHYWLGRTAAAAGRDPKRSYARAATWITTFYGQLSALALGDSSADLAERIRKARDPGWTPEAARSFAGHEVMRAAAWLIAWGDSARGRQFLLRMDELAPIPAERALTAAFATDVGEVDSAVTIARRMGRDGMMLPRLGWPAPFSPPKPPDSAFSLGIMRQESSFDVAAVSSSGARGLMQLMPPTATAVAKGLGAPVSIPNLTVDPNANMQLGTAYLQEVLQQFGGWLPLAAAGYNAGPHRVGQWLKDIGDPRAGPIDMVDWMELIPFNETRNYVQRVVENTVIYRAHQHDDTPILAGPWSR